jgi:hypothetical protein
MNAFERVLIGLGERDGFEGPAGGAAFDGVKDGHGVEAQLSALIGLLSRWTYLCRFYPELFPIKSHPVIVSFQISLSRK